ncbi:hypothetical protein B5C34_12505 [Pacificimonas flava]|uniref:Uncharacterized protein n=2 Tax=Pacificimonas TaxID=1960290 RepID=A0A219B9D6_9SPHN|nr:hypothetical protein [Pacificimonas aurantium]OWV34774.1 hypothetical protein B5C34_12505 [Pacificimonas flava]
MTGTALPPAIAEASKELAERLGGVAVLFYGSVLRTGDMDALLDFYVLTPDKETPGVRGFLSRHLWPDISFEEVSTTSGIVRAKVATMPLSTFSRAAAGEYLDSTVWTRFVQPAALSWSRDERSRHHAVEAVASAAVTAASVAAAGGPVQARPIDFWHDLFRQTYATEFRVERADRSRQIIAYAPSYYEELLPLAWSAADIPYRVVGEELRSEMSAETATGVLNWWLRQQNAGKLLNLSRLVKAAFTVKGAARYGLQKVEKHTGVTVPLTPFREKHPILAAPGVFFRVWRSAER